jgi:hypothetical protein
MRLLAIVAALAIPRIALADWQVMEDPDCRCELALPDKPAMSTRPSPWPNVAWHRSEVRVSPTEWYAVSYAAFDKAPPAKALETALAGLHGTIVSRSNADARVKLADGTTIAVRLVAHERRVYVVEAGDVAKGTKPDKLFAGFHAWTDKDAPPEGTVGSVTGDLPTVGGALGGTGTPSKPKQSPIVVGVGSVSGSLDKDVVKRALRPSFAKLGACYDQLAKKRQLDPGDVHVDFTIEATGVLSHVRANGIDEQLDPCLAGVVGHVTFPKPDDGRAMDMMVVLQFTH